eukprot:Hpha_TRINITY_DN15885_c0_g6::TRINITY_DN15885_c0_g6_i1::g.189454::m.189454
MPELPLSPAFGTFGSNALKGLPAALRQGVQIVDHAEMYGNAVEVGAALKESPKSVFLVSKLSGLPYGDYAGIEERAQALAKGLGVETIDLLLMHWPGDYTGDPTQSGCLDMDSGMGDFETFKGRGVEAWKNMLKLKEAGLAADVGVSNFYPQHIAVLKEAGLPLPHAVEIFIDPEQQEGEYVKQLQEDGVKVLAYRPLKQKRFPAAFTKVAEELKVSPHGLVLGWLLARGVVPVFSSTQEEHVAQNLADSQTAKEGVSKEFIEGEGAAADTVTTGGEVLSQLCRAHGKTVEVSEEAIGQLVEMMGCDPEKAKKALAQSGGSVEVAIGVLLAEE